MENTKMDPQKLLSNAWLQTTGASYEGQDIDALFTNSLFVDCFVEVYFKNVLKYFLENSIETDVKIETENLVKTITVLQDGASDAIICKALLDEFLRTDKKAYMLVSSYKTNSSNITLVKLSKMFCHYVSNLEIYSKNGSNQKELF